MISFEDMESCIQEWFSERHCYEGVSGIAKTFATITKEAEKQLNYFAVQYEERRTSNEG